MAKKLYGSFYPQCDSQHTTYHKNQVWDGIIYFQDDNLIFQRKLFLLFPLKKDRIEIPISKIKKLEKVKLNQYFPFGVCITLKDHSEYMLGHINNKKLENFVCYKVGK